MSLILNLDTALTKASVSLARNGALISTLSHENQKSHAEFLQAAVQQLMQELQIEFQELDAIAVTSGPGSYTGIRVGMASAKGFAYALQKPFITVNTLETMAFAAIQAAHQEGINFDRVCPMIDARRMEVFTALYDRLLNEIRLPHALILDSESYLAELEQGTILFCGNGSEKWKPVCSSSNAKFISITDLSTSLCALSHQRFLHQSFTDLILSEPFYVKEFFNAAQ